MSMRASIASIIKGDVSDDALVLGQYSHDTSIFERTPSLVVYPKNAEDVAAVVRFAHEAHAGGKNISVTARSGGTDMSGGPLTDSIVLVFTKYINAVGEVRGDAIVVEPGAYYRDFEKTTLTSGGLILPSYPASREICALGGMIANNSGGELTLQYGKTNRYVRELDVVLSDGSRAALRPLSKSELAVKESEKTFEGKIYRHMHALIEKYAAEIEDARPTVTKNSAGYALWNIYDKKLGTFDLTQLIVGSQGTLALVTSARMGLVRLKAHRSMLVVFLSDIGILPEIVSRVLKFSPESFESYDDQTFRLAVRFIPQIIGHLGFVKMLALGFAFVPEMWMTITGGVPKLILMAEFAEDTPEEAHEKANAAQAALADLAVHTKIAANETQTKKYWTIRRESFSLLRKNLHGLHTAPFIDDIVVHPADYPQFLPELNALLKQYDLLYTIAGHAGDGNFHIIPLMDMGKRANRKTILELLPKVLGLVAKYHGSIDGEHNDGIIRTPYLSLMFGEKMCGLFAEVKKIFDPLNILNPGKKVGGTIEDIEKSMIKK